MSNLQNIKFELVTYPVRSVLIIQLSSLPEHIQTQVLTQRVRSWSQVINYYSAFTHFISSRNENYSLKLFKEFFENHSFQGSFEEFVEKYNLLLEKYLIDNNILTDNISEIIIEC